MRQPAAQGTTEAGAEASLPLVAAGNFPKVFVYPFFLFHMLMFGISGFLLAYGVGDVIFLYMHGGIAIVVYVIFYLLIFGRDQVQWMFINAALGVVGIYSQIGWILSLFGRDAGDYPCSTYTRSRCCTSCCTRSCSGNCCSTSPVRATTPGAGGWWSSATWRSRWRSMACRSGTTPDPPHVIRGAGLGVQGSRITSNRSSVMSSIA
jgi:hypothetical protein